MKTFKIVGNKYGTEKKFWDNNCKYYTYDSIDEKTFGPYEFEDINHAEKWMIENHPDYFFGCNIIGVDNTDFALIAVPEYWETTENTTDREKLISIAHQRICDIIDGKVKIVVEEEDYYDCDDDYDEYVSNKSKYSSYFDDIEQCDDCDYDDYDY